MPPQPLIASESTRALVLAAIMAVILVAALAATQLVGGFKPAVVGDLSLKVPRRWIESGSHSAQQGLESVSVYQPAAKLPPVLTVCQHAPVTPTDPRSALEQVKSLAVHGGDAARNSDIRVDPIRIGPLIGVRYAGVAVDPHTPMALRLRLIAVLTMDGSRYWSISLMDVVPFTPGAANTQDLPFDTQFFDRLCTSVVVRGSQGGDLANLSFAGEPRLLADPDSGFRLRRLRARRELDATAFKTGTLLSPPELLTSAFWQVQQSPPPDDAVTNLTVGATEQWRLTLPRRSAKVERQLWYVRRAPNEAAILELLCEADDVAASVKWCEGQVQTMTFAGPAVEVGQALDRGVQLAKAQAESLAAVTPTPWTFDLVERRGTPLGLAASRILPIQDSGPRLGAETAPLMGLGKSLTVVNEQVLMETVSQWFASPDAQQFLVTTVSSLPHDGPQKLVLTRRDDRLSLVQVEGSESKELWSFGPVPASYLPPIGEDRWPNEPIMSWLAAPAASSTLRLRPEGSSPSSGSTASSLPSGADSPRGALVWWSPPARLGVPPVACWLQVAPVSAGQAPPGSASKEMPARISLQIRPLMTMDADLAWLDADGRVLRYDQADPTGSGSATLTIARADRVTILEKFPWLEKNLDAWLPQIKNEQDPRKQEQQKAP